MELVRIFKEHNVFGWISVGTAILSLLLLNVAIISNVTFYSYQMLPFAMAVPFGIIELFIKKDGRTDCSVSFSICSSLSVYIRSLRLIRICNSVLNIKHTLRMFLKRKNAD